MFRDYTLGEVNESLIGKKVKLVGWADTIRAHGNFTFIDLRDRYGKVQGIIDKKSADFLESKRVTTESCIQIEGEIKSRPKGTENKDLVSGKVEIAISNLKILTLASPLPFELTKDDVNEDLRLKYRYLDIRRTVMTKNLELRHKIINFIRNYLDEKQFLEVTTPMLTKSTPEGARDFIVPSRLHPGKFYALPQSPQQYKQLLMVAGIDKYFQIAACFRDEDARADRSPGEFYQLDMEMSFVEQKDILDLVEDMILKLVKELLPSKKLTFQKIPRLTYDEVMKKYGTDKPDLRKDKNNLDELAFAFVVDFPLFELKKEEKKWGAVHHPFTRPKLEKDETIEQLIERIKKDPGEPFADQYDFVLNGYEIGGGSLRIHEPKLLEAIFEILGHMPEDITEKFGHLLNAFKYGVPPHGGIALGLDRIVMILEDEPSIREVIAFPKTGDGRDLMMNAPSEVDDKQLKDLHIKTLKS